MGEHIYGQSQRKTPHQNHPLRCTTMERNGEIDIQQRDGNIKQVDMIQYQHLNQTKADEPSQTLEKLY